MRSLWFEAELEKTASNQTASGWKAGREHFAAGISSKREGCCLV